MVLMLLSEIICEKGSKALEGLKNVEIGVSVGRDFKPPEVDEIVGSIVNYKGNDITEDKGNNNESNGSENNTEGEENRETSSNRMNYETSGPNVQNNEKTEEKNKEDEKTERYLSLYDIYEKQVLKGEKSYDDLLKEIEKRIGDLSEEDFIKYECEKPWSSVDWEGYKKTLKNLNPEKVKSWDIDENYENENMKNILDTLGEIIKGFVEKNKEYIKKMQELDRCYQEIKKILEKEKEYPNDLIAYIEKNEYIRNLENYEKQLKEVLENSPYAEIKKCAELYKKAQTYLNAIKDYKNSNEKEKNEIYKNLEKFYGELMNVFKDNKERRIGGYDGENRKEVQ